MPTDVDDNLIEGAFSDEEEEIQNKESGNGLDSNEGENISERQTGDIRTPIRRQTSVQRELIDAIVRLDPIEELQLLLKLGAKVNATVRQGLTPLHYAVWQRYTEAAELLISKGCEINATDDIGYSALHLSAEHGYIEMMEVLLKHNCLVNYNFPSPDDEEYPVHATDEPLRLALKHDHYDAAQMLLEHGANPNSKYFFGSEINLVNPLHTKLIQLLLVYGADPNARDRHGYTPLMKTCRLQQGLEGCLALITFGADLNMRAGMRHDFRSVLHYAVLSGSTAIVNLLIKQGASVTFEDDYNKPTPLDLAILKGDVEMVKLLLQFGADPNGSSSIIGSPLHVACTEAIQNRLEIIQILVDKGANPNLIIIGEDGSPIRPVLAEYLANDDPDVKVVNLLLRYGAEVVMQSQNRDPQGLLNCLPNLTKYPKVMIALLEAAHRFDLSIILHSSLIDNDQREIYLKIGKSPLSLKHMSRIFLRQTLGPKLPKRIDELELPTIMNKYLLYEIS